MQTKVIAEDRFTTHQKIHLVLILGPIFTALIFIIMAFFELNIFLCLVGVCISFVFVLFLAFSKRGLLRQDEDLYRGLFFGRF